MPPPVPRGMAASEKTGTSTSLAEEICVPVQMAVIIHSCSFETIFFIRNPDDESKNGVNVFFFLLSQSTLVQEKRTFKSRSQIRCQMVCADFFVVVVVVVLSLFPVGFGWQNIAPVLSEIGMKRCSSFIYGGEALALSTIMAVLAKSDRVEKIRL